MGQGDVAVLVIPGLGVGDGDEVRIGHLLVFQVIGVNVEVIGADLFAGFLVHDIVLGDHVHFYGLAGTGLGFHHQLIVDALEQHALDLAAHDALPGLHDGDVLRTDQHVHRLVRAETEVCALKGLIIKADLVVRQHGAFHDVAFTDEAGNIGVGRLVVDLQRGADLLDGAGVHNHDFVAHGQGFFLVMGDEDEGNADLLLDALQFTLHLLAQLQVQGAQGLVQQQDVRLVHQGAGDGNTLLLAAGELGDVALFVAFQVHQGKHTVDLLGDDIIRQLFDAQAESDILKNVQMGEQGVALEDRVDLPFVGRYVVDALAVKDDRAFVLLQETAQDTQQCGLAAAGGTQQRHKFIFIDIQIDTLEYDLAVKILDDIPEFDQFPHAASLL